ncbi:MAG: T9SS type A sorting domain-containing protein [Haliscomenobacter sp.]|nr:T9SS type A sorting domain-containing protein [Haliscomenobacter sp.]
MRRIRNYDSGEQWAGSTLGCGSISNDLTGKVALIDRGTCSFAEKVLNAQNKGAKAVVVINNAADTTLINMGPTDPFSKDVVIPSFFVTQSTGNALKTALNAGQQIAIAARPVAEQDPLARTIVWGNLPGQGDFAGGRNGWTVNNIWCINGQTKPKGDLWQWSADAFAPGNCGRGDILSPTRCNGAMAFASNFLDDKGGACGQGLGTGDCPVGQLGELISPVIPLRGQGTSGYTLKFYQSLRQFNSDYFLLWSVNGGATWDTTAINQEFETYEVNTVPYLLVPLSGTANADSLIVKFLFQGNYYFWVIDDVQILVQEPNNLRITDFYALPANMYTPLSQVEPVGFLADVANIGSQAQAGVRLKMTVQDSTAAVRFQAENALGALASNSLLENQVVPGTFTPNAVGSYKGAYEVISGLTDFDPTDNVRSFTFFVTDSTFAKEDGTNTRTISPDLNNWAANEPPSVAYGNVFYVPRGKGVFSRNIQFVIPNAEELKGRGLILSLYQWTDTNGDRAAQAAERTLAAFNFYEVLGTESNPLRLISVPVPGPEEPPLELEDSTTYLVMLEYYAPAVDGITLDALISTRYDYKAQYLLSLLNGKPRFTTMTGTAGDLTKDTYSPIGFSPSVGDYSYVIRWDISKSGGVTPTLDLPSIDDQTAVFPNPATELVHIQFDLKEPAKVMTVEWIDPSGRVLSRYRWENIQKEIRSIPAAGLSPGIYFLRMVSDQGWAVKKVAK